jgi:CubicO group peptidase (beta-lactamase class C family)
MINKLRNWIATMLAIILPSFSVCAGDLNLVELATTGKLKAINRTLQVTNGAIYLSPAAGGGVVWLPGIEFSEGTIELELRGRNAPGASFVGVAFHAADENNYDSVYLRPFNFRAEEVVRRKRAIQYISIPGHDWPELRENFPGKYEAAIDPAPAAEDWCTLRLVIKAKQLQAFINGSGQPSLTVTLLNNKLRGKVGLWVGNNSDGWFRKISVTTNTHSAPATAQSGTNALNSKESLQRDMPRWMNDFKVPVAAVALIDQRRLSWAKVFHHHASPGSSNRHTHFNVASMTKPVFAMTVLQLVKNGIISLDEPLAPYWIDPDIKDDPRHRALTARICLSHRTGFPNWRRQNKLSFSFDPGEMTSYSGEGYDYLRRALEGKTGKTLEELVALHVFKPAGMTNSFLTWRKHLEQTYSGGFDRRGQRLPDFKPTEPTAADDLLTTIEDFANFTGWVLNGADLPKPLFNEFTRIQKPSGQSDGFGLGWHVWNHSGLLLTHGGTDRGVNSEAFLDMGSGKALVIFTASDNGELLIRSALPVGFERGRELVRAKDQSNWNLIRKMPPEEFVNNREFILESPAIQQKLLQALLCGNNEAASLTVADLQRADSAIHSFVRAQLSQPGTNAKAQQVLDLLTFYSNGKPMGVKTGLTHQIYVELITLLERNS